MSTGSFRGRGSRGGRGRGGGETTQGTSGYRGGDTPYHSNARGGRGGRRNNNRNNEEGGYRNKREDKKQPNNAEDQFNMLFGGPSKEEKKTKAAAVPVDDAIILEDEAIVIEDDAVIVETKDRKNSNIDALNALIGDTKGSKNLNENDIAILTATQQKPLWVEENRQKFTRKQLLESYVENSDIDFTLFDENYITVFEVFNQQSQGPFANDQESQGMDLKRFQERNPGASKHRDSQYKGSKAGWNASTKDWKNKPADGEEEDEPDPDWIEFDPESDTNKQKFWGHVMHDEQKLRDRVVYKKEQKQQRVQEKKQKMAEQAKFEIMTSEQRDLIEKSKNEENKESVDQQKLKEAEALAAQIEAESYSKFDVDFESKKVHTRFGASTDEQILNDDQLVDLFSEMKKESQAKAAQKMERFKIEKQISGGDELLDEFNDELEAMRGEDSPDDGLLQDVSNQYRQNVPKQPLTSTVNVPLEALEELEEEPKEEEPEPKYYNDDFKKEIEAYRAQVAIDNKNKKTVDNNLDAIFQNFQVVTQQRHKISLEQINASDTEMKQRQEVEGLQARNSLVTNILSQINPFSQYVVQDILHETHKNDEENPAEDNDEERHWKLHENLFKKGPEHVVNPDNLIKTSSQMFSVYKYYENPGLQVQSNYYTQQEDYSEVRTLVPNIKFFDAPQTSTVPDVQVAN